MALKLKISNICVSCDSCRVICPEEAIFTQDNDYFVENWSCTLCSLCLHVCPVDAIKPVENIKDKSSTHS